MTTNDVEQRLAAIEQRLGMDHEPPLDRLSGIELKIDTVRSLVQQLGLSIGEQQRFLVVLEARQLEHDARFSQLEVGQATIIAMLSTLIEGEGATTSED